MNTGNTILRELEDYNYTKGINKKLDKILEIIGSRFNDFNIDELSVHNTDNKEVKYFDSEEWYECTNPECPDEFDEWTCPERCPYMKKVVEEVEKTKTERTITSESSIRIVLTKHVDDDKESITFTTNSEYMYINTYIRTWTTGRRPQMSWKCISQLKEAI